VHRLYRIMKNLRSLAMTQRTFRREIITDPKLTWSKWSAFAGRMSQTTIPDLNKLIRYTSGL